jgi:hypothetical protein
MIFSELEHSVQITLLETRILVHCIFLNMHHINNGFSVSIFRDILCQNKCIVDKPFFYTIKFHHVQ